MLPKAYTHLNCVGTHQWCRWRLCLTLRLLYGKGTSYCYTSCNILLNISSCHMRAQYSCLSSYPLLLISQVGLFKCMQQKRLMYSIRTVSWMIAWSDFPTALLEYISLIICGSIILVSLITIQTSYATKYTCMIS